MKANLIDDRDDERDYQLPNGNIVTLRYEPDSGEITFWDGEEQLGGTNDCFYFIDHPTKDNYLLARMYVPKELKNMGLGRACIEFFGDYVNSSIYVRPDDGVERDDGSHLTEDAPGFVAKMIEEGLIIGYKTCPYEESDEYDDFEFFPSLNSNHDNDEGEDEDYEDNDFYL